MVAHVVECEDRPPTYSLRGSAQEVSIKMSSSTLCGSHHTCVGQLPATVPQTLSNVLNKLFSVPLYSGLKKIIAFAAGTADKIRSAVVSLRVR